MLELIYKILDRLDGDIDEATDEVYDGPKKLALYVISIGLITIMAKKRAIRRRELRREVKPEYRKGRVTGSIEFTPNSKKKIFQAAEELFGDDGWKIGKIMLANFTKESLLEKAALEEKSATGHLKNAQFYRALAEPMKAGQLVKDHWTPETATAVKKKIWKDSDGKRPELV